MTRRRALSWLFALASLLSFGVPAHAADPAWSGQELYLPTQHVEDLAVLDGSLWVATRGGVERYALASGRRLAHYTPAHGLVEPAVLQITTRSGRVVAQTAEQDCLLAADGKRFSCLPTPRRLTPKLSVLGTHRGARITARKVLGSRAFLGTAGQGLWVTSLAEGSEPAARRLGDAAPLCDEHVNALAEFRGELYVGGFNRGLCRKHARGFDPIAAPFRSVNALLVAENKLYVAAAEGLFSSDDARSFQEVTFVSQSGANGLAADARYLWITTPGALWRVPLGQRGSNGVWWRPAGSRSLQGLAVRGRHIWLASEDRGGIRFDGNAFTAFDKARGLPSSWVLSVAIDDRGTAYLGTLQDGVVAVDRHGRSRTLDAFDEHWVLRLTHTDAGLVIGTQSGAALVRGDATHWLPGLPDGRVHAALTSAGLLYVGTERGLWAARVD